MSALSYSDDLLRSVLTDTRTIALVGASNKPDRASYRVMKYMLDKGFIVHPVNPGMAGQEILGRIVYGSLAEVPGEVDMIDIFRASEAAGQVVDEALCIAREKNIKVVWMQLEIRNGAAAERAEAQGITVIMDRCPKIEHARLFR